MKVLVQSIICSVAVHVIYFIGIMLVGYVQTMNYKPDVASAYNHVEMLQTEVVFGMIISPFFLIYTFFGVAICSAVIIILYSNIVKKRGIRREN